MLIREIEIRCNAHYLPVELSLPLNRAWKGGHPAPVELLQAASDYLLRIGAVAPPPAPTAAVEPAAAEPSEDADSASEPAPAPLHWDGILAELFSADLKPYVPSEHWGRLREIAERGPVAGDATYLPQLLAYARAEATGESHGVRPPALIGPGAPGQSWGFGPIW